ncbi:MAG TPA: aminomethyl-transferring glycine dehydrogenase subunit GcvPA [Actinomycetota bacterium]|nr:aminomethyl-transferring glycine dehydrogenase subunit GcvPA [Actinomycetota bacterium]
MDYTPHTPEDIEQMLDAIGVGSIEELFSPIPGNLRLGRRLQLGDPKSESEVYDQLYSLASLNSATDRLTCFAGGGAYDHYIPAAVRACAGRSEFLTSYTPYQPELSQGVLGAVFDYQSMICELTGMEIAGSGLYDGAAALNEAVHLASAATGRKKVVVSQAINPNYRKVLDSLGRSLGYEFVTAPAESGVTDFGDVSGAAAVVVGQPNFFGCLEDVAAAAELAHSAGALLIVHFDPLSVGLLESPGALGADVVVGEGQCLGNDLNYGGPYLGIFATRLEHARRMPGRIVGATVDVHGNPGYVLTLQTREQHIRREKATSNVCTDQTLMAVTASVYLSWLGPKGLRELGERCVSLTHRAADLASELPGCRVRFDAPFFREFVLEVPGSARDTLSRLAANGYLAGPSLEMFPGMENCLLVAATERRSVGQVEQMVKTLGQVIA